MSTRAAKPTKPHPATDRDWWWFPVPLSLRSMIAELGADAALLYVLLRSYAHPTDHAWPSYRELRSITGWGATRLSNALKSLRAARAIHHLPRPHPRAAQRYYVSPRWRSTIEHTIRTALTTDETEETP